MSIDRRVFIGGAGAIIGGALGSSGLSEAAELMRRPPTPITKPEWDALTRSYGRAQFTCTRTASAVEGPYYYPSSPLRRTVNEGHKGEKLVLGITLGGMLAPGGGCFPLSGAVVDIWQTDAAGLYSNVGDDLQTIDTKGQMFLRGHQLTDDKGYVEFETIVPGWEVIAVPPPIVVGARTVHIHVKVYHGSDVLTTQLYFPDPFLDQLFTDVEPYRSHIMMTAPGLPKSYPRVRNADDRLFLVDASKPMPVERVNGVLTAKATIGMISQGNRGIPTLFR